MLCPLRDRAATITKIGQETRNTMVLQKKSIFYFKSVFSIFKILLFPKTKLFWFIFFKYNYIFGNKNKILKIEKTLLKLKYIFLL